MEAEGQSAGFVMPSSHMILDMWDLLRMTYPARSFFLQMICKQWHGMKRYFFLFRKICCQFRGLHCIHVWIPNFMTFNWNWCSLTHCSLAMSYGNIEPGSVVFTWEQLTGIAQATILYHEFQIISLKCCHISQAQMTQFAFLYCKQWEVWQTAQFSCDDPR